MPTIFLKGKKRICIEEKIVGFLVIFIYGVTVYHCNSEKSFGNWWVGLLSPLNSTLFIFFPSRGGYEEDFDSIAFHYTLLHLLSYLYIAMLGMSLFGRKLMNRASSKFVFPRFKNIFWGYSDGGVLLAKDIMNHTFSDRAIFVMPENIPLSREVEQYRFEEIDGIEGIVLYKDLSKEIDIRAVRHFFLTEDQDLNVKLAFMVLEAIEKRNKRRWKCKNKFICKCICKIKKKRKQKDKPVWRCRNRFICKCVCKFKRIHKIVAPWIYKWKQGRVSKLYVRTELEYVDKYFTEKLKRLKGKVEVHTINESELTARRFISKYPSLEMPKVICERETKDDNKKFSILQLGYGWSGKSILDKLICNTQFGGWTFSATIFDKDLKTKHDYPK